MPSRCHYKKPRRTSYLQRGLNTYRNSSCGAIIAATTITRNFFIVNNISLLCLVLKGCVLEFLEGATELVGTRSALGTATDTIELVDYIVDALATNQLADTLQVAIASAKEKHLLDDIVLISGYVDQLRACALRLVLYMFCLHILY